MTVTLGLRYSQCCWLLKVVTCHRCVWGKQKPDENCNDEQNPQFLEMIGGAIAARLSLSGLLKSPRQKYRQKSQRRGLWF